MKLYLIFIYYTFILSSEKKLLLESSQSLSIEFSSFKCFFDFININQSRHDKVEFSYLFKYLKSTESLLNIFKIKKFIIYKISWNFLPYINYQYSIPIFKIKEFSKDVQENVKFKDSYDRFIEIIDFLEKAIEIKDITKIRNTFKLVNYKFNVEFNKINDYYTDFIDSIMFYLNNNIDNVIDFNNSSIDNENMFLFVNTSFFNLIVSKITDKFNLKNFINLDAININIEKDLKDIYKFKNEDLKLEGFNSVKKFLNLKNYIKLIENFLYDKKIKLSEENLVSLNIFIKDLKNNLIRLFKLENIFIIYDLYKSYIKKNNKKLIKNYNLQDLIKELYKDYQNIILNYNEYNLKLYVEKFKDDYYKFNEKINLPDIFEFRKKIYISYFYNFHANYYNKYLKNKKMINDMSVFNFLLDNDQHEIKNVFKNTKVLNLFFDYSLGFAESAFQNYDISLIILKSKIYEKKENSNSLKIIDFDLFKNYSLYNIENKKLKILDKITPLNLETESNPIISSFILNVDILKNLINIFETLNDYLDPLNKEILLSYYKKIKGVIFYHEKLLNDKILF